MLNIDFIYFEELKFFPFQVYFFSLSMLLVVSGKVFEIHQLQCLHYVCYEGKNTPLSPVPFILIFCVQSTNFCSSANAAYKLLVRNLVGVVVLDR